jgi:2-polyprenyl-6-methoxyphenol hydroxylase-like FAD-dependent oxidoreductase
MTDKATDQTRAIPLLIIGAGIGGMATALALARRGLEVIVFEQAQTIGEIGAGIQLAPNALRVLDELGVLAEVSAGAVRPPAATLRDATTGEVITRLEFDDAFEAKYGYGYLVTHRSDLHRAITTAALATELVTVKTNARVHRLKEGTSDVTIELESGDVLSAEAVIGADGLHSVVRKHVTGGDDVVYVGDFAYRGTVDYEAVAEREGKDDVTWWVGPSMHLIQYPVRGTRLYNQVAVFSGACEGDDTESWGTAQDFDQHFAGKHEAVRQGAQLLPQDRRWAMVDREPISHWTSGRITLLGDAAHPMVQYLAQGACQALEDAACIAKCLNGSDNYETAFATYEGIRRPRTATVQTWARRMGEIVHAGGAFAAIRDELLHLHPSNELDQIAWLYGNGQSPKTPQDAT